MMSFSFSLVEYASFSAAVVDYSIGKSRGGCNCVCVRLADALVADVHRQPSTNITKNYSFLWQQKLKNSNYYVNFGKPKRGGRERKSTSVSKNEQQASSKGGGGGGGLAKMLESNRCNKTLISHAAATAANKAADAYHQRYNYCFSGEFFLKLIRSSSHWPWVEQH